MTEVDIVRQLHGAADRAGLVCTKTGNFRAAMIDAGHLRAAADEIDRLRAERDEARREVCSMNETGLRMNESDKKREAKRRGWDCFKEDR